MPQRSVLILLFMLVACGTPTALPPTPVPQPTVVPTPTSTPVPPTAVPQPTVPAPETPIVMMLASPAFADGASIAVEYACDGVNQSPALEWSAPPAGTQSLALIMEDPDANNYTHWVLFNMPPETRMLAPAIAKGEKLDGIGMHGQNGFAQPGYNGPCPDPGDTHTYIFTLYALNSPLPLDPSPLKPVSKGMVREAMQGRILGEGRLIGLYTRP